MISSPKDPQNSTSRLKHWDKTYKSNDLPTYPSQFAVFVCDYLDPEQNLVEFGCGSGRDSMFFAWQGFKVFGFDGCETAIAKCTRLASLVESTIPDFNQLLIETEREVSAAIESLSGKRTIIIIAHRLSTVRHCDQLIFMRDGRIEDTGTFNSLASSNTAFRNLVKLGELN